jgi:hypothetical protein
MMKTNLQQTWEFMRSKMIGKRHLYTKFKTQYYSFEVSIPIVTELLFFRNSFPNLNNKNSKLLVTHRKWKMLTHKFLHVTGPNLPLFLE